MKKKQFAKIVKENYDEISFMNERIISCLNETNLSIYES